MLWFWEHTFKLFVYTVREEQKIHIILRRSQKNTMVVYEKYY